MGRKKSFRSWEQSLIAGAVLLLVSPFIAFVYLTPSPNNQENIAVELLFAAYFGIGIGALVRGAFAALIVSDTRVTVRNVFSTRHFAWDEVDRFELGIEHLTPFKFAAALWTNGGNEVTIFAVQEPNFNVWSQRKETAAARMVAELNQILEGHRVPSSFRRSG